MFLIDELHVICIVPNSKPVFKLLDKHTQYLRVVFSFYSVKRSNKTCHMFNIALGTLH